MHRPNNSALQWVSIVMLCAMTQLARRRRAYDDDQVLLRLAKELRSVRTVPGELTPQPFPPPNRVGFWLLNPILPCD
jgi:hypothetical protein